MNREQRRRAAKAAPRYNNLTPEQQRARLFRNGITDDDLYREHEKGWKDGYRTAQESIMRTCYAAAILALHDLEGYGHKRNTRFLRLMDQYVVTTVDNEEIMEEIFRQGGVKIAFRMDMTNERVQEVKGSGA